MRAELRRTGFDDFLSDFAQAVELAASGEIEEGRALLAESQQRAEEMAGEDGTGRGAVLYRYEIGQRVFGERYGRR